MGHTTRGSRNTCQLVTLTIAAIESKLRRQACGTLTLVLMSLEVPHGISAQAAEPPSEILFPRCKAAADFKSGHIEYVPDNRGLELFTTLAR